MGIFRLKRGEIVGGGRRMNNKELHNFSSSPGIIIAMKSSRTRWAGYVARRGLRGMYTKFWWESKKERDHH
jgi:hypothetical protein